MNKEGKSISEPRRATNGPRRGRPRKDGRDSEDERRSYWMGEVFIEQGWAWATELVEIEPSDGRRRWEALPLCLGLDSDNGSEFINHHLYSYCRREGITFTRSRSYKKNDSCHVEQKNWSVVRRLVGYDRYTSHAAFETLHRIYDLLRLYVNFFQPVMKLVSKTRRGAKVHKSMTGHEHPISDCWKQTCL